MMGPGTDAAGVTGRLFAGAPGPRVRAAEAARLGNDVSAGSTVDRARGRITFPGAADHVVVLASPSGGAAEAFRVSGLVDSAITVGSGARVTIEVVNADPGAANGLVVTAGGSSSGMPMMDAGLAFGGSAVWFLGNPTPTGLHAHLHRGQARHLPVPVLGPGQGEGRHGRNVRRGELIVTGAAAPPQDDQP
jgi:hypothetical protein